MSRIHALPGQRLAIRHGSVSLAVPTMHPKTPGFVRQQVFELVLRRLYGEACELAVAVADEITYHSAESAKLAALMSATPHASRRGLGLAAA